MSSRTTLDLAADEATAADELTRDDEAALAEESTPDDSAERAESATEEAAATAKATSGTSRRRLPLRVLTALAVLLAIGVGYVKWLDGSERASRSAAEESVRAARESTVAILSYKPETVDQDLKAAADRLTAGFRDQYTQLVSDVVAPGAKQQHISAVATVPAAASVSATGKHAVALVFVDQTTTIGADAPTQSTSSVRVSLDNVGGRWLIAQFDPV